MEGKNLLGRKIKKIRMEKGMTLEEFGKLFDATKANVWAWEKGRNLPNKKRLKKIAELEKLTVSELLEGETIQANMVDILVNLYQLATAEDIIDGETNDPITVKKYQKMIKDEVLDLSKVLGVQLEREASND